MPPGTTRPFSTTRRVAQQQLYKPYVPELNQEQIKAIRTVARKKAPNYHGHSAKDAIWVLKSFSRSGTQRTLLQDTLERVREIVKKHAGDNVDVKDVSMHTYSSHIHDAPFEFAIVDKSRKSGISPEEDLTKLPIVYDASRLSEILTNEGFTGGFWAPPWDMGKMQDNFTKMPPPQRDLTIPWPLYRRPQLRQYQYPARIITYSPVAFSITLPGPSVMRLHELLRSYFQFSSAMGPLLTTLFIWTRSHGLDEFTTQCLALMVIRYMQEVDKVPILTVPDHPSLSNPRLERKLKTQIQSEMWVPYQYPIPRPDGVDVDSPRKWHVEPTQLRHTIASVKVPRLYPQKPRTFFWDFLNFWRNGAPIAHTYALSVGENKYLRRRLPLLRNREADIATTFKLMEQKAIADGFDPTSTKYDPQWQSFPWQLQALVVQDPFIPTYNHAESVSRETMSYFIRHAQITSRRLAHSWPFMTCFGRGVTPPQEKHADTFRRKQSMSLERRYHTDAVRIKPKHHAEITKPSKDVLARRAKTISRVQNFIRNKYGKKYSVEAFGSTEYGVSNANSDLDLVIIDSDRMEGFPPGTSLTELPDIYNIKKLSHRLSKAGFIRVQAIPTAAVPIVKFKDRITGLNCDINVNEQLGRLNTGLIKRYCDIVPILRPMVAFLKRWAQPLGLNSPSMSRVKSPTFSSYALMLMTISYLQSRGLAPNLQEGLKSARIPGSIFWMRQGSKRGNPNRLCCHTSYHLGHGWTAKEAVDYKDALIGWFRYWGTEHSYSASVASIRQGGFILKYPELQSMEAPEPIDLGPVGKNILGIPTVPKHTGLVDDIITLNPTPQGRDARDSIATWQNPGSALRAVDEVPDNIMCSDAADNDAANGVNTELVETRDYPGCDAVDSISIPLDGIFQRDELGKVSVPSPPSPPRKQQHWPKVPLCVVDPFIRKKIVTKSIGYKTLELFTTYCEQTANMLSQGASLDYLVVKTKLKKASKKIPKLPAPPARLQTSVAMQGDKVSVDTIPTKIQVAFSDETARRYPGAIAPGPSEHASSDLSETDQVFIDDDEDFPEGLEREYPPKVPRRTLPEFELEGFGIKQQYLAHEETEVALGSPH